MTTFFIGQLLEVKPTERTDKKTRQLIRETEVTVMFDGYDESGHRVPSIERASIPEHYFDVLREAKGKFVAIAYRTIHTQNGTYIFPDSDLPPRVMDANPLNFDEYNPDAKPQAKRAS